MDTIDVRLDRTFDRFGLSPYPAVIGGALATVLAIWVLRAVPVVVEFDPLQEWILQTTGVLWWDNPLPILPFFAGFIGGATAGFLTDSNWYEGVIDGMKAVALGVAVFYVFLVFNLSLEVASQGGINYSIVTVIAVNQMVYFLIPMGILYSFEGIIGCLYGNAFSKALDSIVGGYGPSKKATVAAIAVAVTTLLLVGLWLLIFSMGVQYSTV